VHTTLQDTIRDLWKRVNIVKFGLKIEWLDSESGEVLSAGLARRGTGVSQQPASWQELDALFKTVAEQTRCHFDNNRLQEKKKHLECDSIVIEAAE
jgi:hypothetical protein